MLHGPLPGATIIGGVASTVVLRFTCRALCVVGRLCRLLCHVSTLLWVLAATAVSTATFAALALRDITDSSSHIAEASGGFSRTEPYLGDYPRQFRAEPHDDGAGHDEDGGHDVDGDDRERQPAGRYVDRVLRGRGEWVFGERIGCHVDVALEQQASRKHHQKTHGGHDKTTLQLFSQGEPSRLLQPLRSFEMAGSARVCAVAVLTWAAFASPLAGPSCPVNATFYPPLTCPDDYSCCKMPTTPVCAELVPPCTVCAECCHALNATECSQCVASQCTKDSTIGDYGCNTTAPSTWVPWLESCCGRGVALPASRTLPNCLLIGDSVTDGLSSIAIDMLKNECQTQIYIGVDAAYEAACWGSHRVVSSAFLLATCSSRSPCVCRQRAGNGRLNYRLGRHRLQRGAPLSVASR